MAVEFAELLEKELVEAFRRWRDVTIGGLDRSFLTGSASGAAGGFARRFDVGLCNPPVELGLLIFARGGGGRIEALLEMLPVALGGRDVVDMLLALRVGGFTGNRLGDWLVRSGLAAEDSSPSEAFERSYLDPDSEGLRSDRVLEGMVDMVVLLMLGCGKQSKRPVDFSGFGGSVRFGSFRGLGSVSDLSDLSFNNTPFLFYINSSTSPRTYEVCIHNVTFSESSTTTNLRYCWQSSSRYT